MSAPYKTLLTVDAETRWASKPCDWAGDEGYTLSKMTTEEYIRDKRFKAFGFCIHEYGSPAPVQWYSHKELPRILASYDWKTTGVLAHNAQFDVGILSMRYGVKPAFIYDSLSMARALRGVEVGNSLMKLAEVFGLPPKGRAVHSTDGLWDLPTHVERELAEYCKHDVYLCEQIFARLLYNFDEASGSWGKKYPASELRLIDMTIRMFTEPELLLDVAMLEKAVEEDAARLAAALEKVGVEESTLASNAKFVEILEQFGVAAPMKKSKTTGQPALALAKTDALFQAMLNGDNEDVALLCEARLRVKSTQARTRGKRFIGIASRGALPVPLNYFGATTGRWTAGGSVNLQNMKRGSFLRKAVYAPDGYSLIVGDLSQIEPRVLAWMADYTDMLDIFRAGGDPYATFGAQMFGKPGMTKESEPLLRQSAKSALLGCFGPDTRVLTQRGWVSIVDVLATDTTWDGIEWTRHSGVVAQGEKEVLTWKGLSATSDHEILTERGWQAWSAVLQSPSLFRSAQALATLPAFDGSGSTIPERTGRATVYSTPSCDASAGGKVSFIGQTLKKALARAAAPARITRPYKHGTQISGTTAYAQTPRTGIDSWTASAQSSCAAPTRKTKAILTMVDAVSQYMRHGWRIVRSSWRTLSRWMDGTGPNCSSTAPTTAKAIAQETYGSSHAVSTWPTSEKSKRVKSSISEGASPPSKQRVQTYDIALAGPRNRYTVLTDDGPLVVHNCGFQLGWASFAAQLLVGFLGAPPVRYTKADAVQLGVTQADVAKFLSWDENVEKMMEIPHTCTEQELLIHCLATKAIVEKYRKAAWPVVDFWELLGNLLRRSLVGGEEYVHKCLTFRKGEIVLPNGMSLLYPDIQAETDKKGRVQYSYNTGKARTKLYAGKLCNNVIQGTARIVMTDGMRRASKKYMPKFTVHDEFGVLCPDIDIEEGTKFIHDCMVQEPAYMPGLFLQSDVGCGKRYGSIK